MNSDFVISSASPLQLADAVAALIVVEGDGYLMQRRDQRADIWYPNCWGLFGGALERGEDEVAALGRELQEELELAVDRPQFFARFTFDLSGAGLSSHIRSYYVVRISRATYAKLVLHEGAEMKVFANGNILAEPRVSPYDSFAIFLHFARGRLSARHKIA